MEHRKECEDCGKGFWTKNAQARFCSDTCRYLAWDREHPRTPVKQPYNGSAGGKRRASRDGKGTRLYLTPDELMALALGSIRPSLLKKADRAVERVRRTR